MKHPLGHSYAHNPNYTTTHTKHHYVNHTSHNHSHSGHKWWFDDNWGVNSSGFATYESLTDIYNTCLALFCVACAGIASGLTVGLLSLDATKLEMKIKIKDSEDGKAAASVLPIVKRHHLLLVTLLLFNALAGEALPVFLEALVPPWLSVLISVTLVLLFGEVLPQVETYVNLYASICQFATVIYSTACASFELSP
jgi:metal transporter CNNM